MKHKQGQSIIETVIAAALISISVLAALALANHSQKQNISAKNLASANTYASETLDWIRTQRDSLGFATLASKGTADSNSGTAIYCLSSIPISPDDFTILTPSTCGPSEYISGTLYTRQLALDTSTAPTGILGVTVTITWEEQATRQVVLETELTSWR